jgi:hypothetical protein
MSETPEIPTRPTTVATEPAAVPVVKPYWLYRFAAWVVIVAGIVFIVTTIFFAGFKVAHLGHHHCHHHGWHHAEGQGPHHHGQGAGFHHGPGAFRDGPREFHAPGGFEAGPGGPGPSQPPASVAPSLAPATP